MMSFVVWWVLGFFGSMVGLTKVANDGYGDVGDAMGYVSSAGGVLLWLFVVQIRPRRPCTGACRKNGSNGKLYDMADRTYFGDCPDCGGSGKQFRWFVFPNHPLRVAARQKAAAGE